MFWREKLMLLICQSVNVVSEWELTPVCMHVCWSRSATPDKE